MESDILGVVLDSSVVIEAERDMLDVAGLLKRLAGNLGERKAALSVVSVAELAHGIHRANTPERRARRRAFLDDLKVTVPIHPVTEVTAELAGRIGAECAAQGVTIPFDDLLIGCCAIERGYAVVTLNLRHFGKIPGLALMPL